MFIKNKVGQIVSLGASVVLCVMGTGGSVLQQQRFRAPKAYISVPRGDWFCYTIWANACEAPYWAECIQGPILERAAGPFSAPVVVYHFRVWIQNKHGYRWLRVLGVQYIPQLRVEAYW